MRNENENKVTISICGKEFNLTTNEEPAYVRQLASKIDRQIRDLMENNDVMSSLAAAVLVCLDCMDDATKVRADMDNIRGEVKNYVMEAGKAREEADKLRDEIETLKHENERLITEMGLKSLRGNI